MATQFCECHSKCYSVLYFLLSQAEGSYPAMYRGNLLYLDRSIFVVAFLKGDHKHEH
jgi:hypothetical protein